MRQSPKSSIWNGLHTMVGTGDIKEAMSIERMIRVSEEDPIQLVCTKGNTRRQLPRS